MNVTALLMLLTSSTVKMCRVRMCLLHGWVYHHFLGLRLDLKSICIRLGCTDGTFHCQSDLAFQNLRQCFQDHFPH